MRPFLTTSSTTSLILSSNSPLYLAPANNLTTDENGNTDVAEVKAGTVYIKELSAPAGYKV
ncbi:prealbumin-like fold domain-containing protein, partial [Clostridioides difficile]|nr:prealbumin-like fold domain-containing protein [Clostridioides difficile]